MTRRTRRLGVSALAAVALTASVPAAASAETVITMSGSTSVAPLASLLAKEYVKTRKGVSFKLAQGGSDVGVADVAAGRVTVGNSSRDPKASDPGGIFFNKIAKDAICIATNPSNPLGDLTQAQIQGIFSGKITSWSDVPGAKATGPINIVVRTPASGTQDAFDKIFMAGTKVGSSASQKASNGLIQQALKSDPNAIGYVSLDFVSGLSTASYKGVACDLRNAKSGEYGGVRNFWMVTRGRATGAVAAFINWAQTSPAAQKVVGTHWVPLT